MQKENILNGKFYFFTFEKFHFLFDIENVELYSITKNALSDASVINVDSLVEFLASNIKDGRKNLKLPTDVKSIPISTISINVTQICNMSCVYCYGKDGEYGTAGVMDLVTAKKSVDYLIRESKNKKQIRISFFGGEPLLNFKLIKETVEYSKQEALKFNKIVRFSITTNGSLLSDTIIKYLNDEKFSCVISFDGNKEIQNKNRPFKNGKGSYNSTSNKIKKFLASRNGNAFGRATLTNNSNTLKDIKNVLYDIGFRRAGATRVTLDEKLKEMRDVDTVSLNQFNDYLKEYTEEANYFLQKIKQREADFIKVKNEKFFRYVIQILKKYKSFYSCGAGRGYVGISKSGEIFACHRFVGEEKFKIGDVWSLENDKTKYEKMNPDGHIVCSKCWVRYFCGGYGCIQDNYIMNGNFEEVNEIYCLEIKHHVKIACYFINMLSNEDREFLIKYLKNKKSF